MAIKKGDFVKILKGKFAGEVGTVINTFADYILVDAGFGPIKLKNEFVELV